MEHEITYETKFNDGSRITTYTAVAIAEGFEESCDKDPIEVQKDIVRAWSYICGTKIYRGLQGYFGRTVASLIEQKYMDDNGKVNWENVENIITR